MLGQLFSFTHSLIKVVNAARATLFFPLSCLKGGREGAGEPADVGDVSDVPQEGLGERRSCEGGGQVGGWWAEGRGTL